MRPRAVKLLRDGEVLLTHEDAVEFFEGLRRSASCEDEVGERAERIDVSRDSAGLAEHAQFGSEIGFLELAQFIGRTAEIADRLATESLQHGAVRRVGAHPPVPVAQLDGRALRLWIRDENRRGHQPAMRDATIMRGGNRLTKEAEQPKTRGEVKARAACEHEVIKPHEALRVLERNHETEVAFVEVVRAQHARMIEGAQRFELDQKAARRTGNELIDLVVTTICSRKSEAHKRP